MSPDLSLESPVLKVISPEDTSDTPVDNSIRPEFIVEDVVVTDTLSPPVILTVPPAPPVAAMPELRRTEPPVSPEPAWTTTLLPVVLLSPDWMVTSPAVPLREAPDRRVTSPLPPRALSPELMETDPEPELAVCVEIDTEPLEPDTEVPPVTCTSPPAPLTAEPPSITTAPPSEAPVSP